MYLHSAPIQNDLKAELLVLEAFLSHWNADGAVRWAIICSNQDGRITVSYVPYYLPDRHVRSSTYHVETKGVFTSRVRSGAANNQNIFAFYICTNNNWRCNSHIYGAATHVFSDN